MLTNPFNADIYHVDSCRSTMNQILELPQLQHGTVLTASFQEDGRGRGQERNWMSPEGQNLLFTIALDPQQLAHPLVRIPLICALGLSDFLNSRFHLSSLLKWPNDVLVSQKKISGILCEYRSGYLLAGMGINCLQEEFSPDLAHKSTSLRIEISDETHKKDIAPDSILEGLLLSLFQRLKSPSWKADAESILYGINSAVDVVEGAVNETQIKSLKIKGLDNDGFLLAEEQGRVRSISTGEIRFVQFMDNN